MLHICVEMCRLLSAMLVIDDSAAQRQNAVSAYFISKHIMPLQSSIIVVARCSQMYLPLCRAALWVSGDAALIVVLRKIPHKNSG